MKKVNEVFAFGALIGLIAGLLLSNPLILVNVLFGLLIMIGVVFVVEFVLWIIDTWSH